jgi:Ni,Fe-hydrogenase III large subunit
LEKILQDHVLDFDIEEVWYFVESDVVRRHLMRVAEVYDSVRIFSLSDDVIAGLPKELGFE